MKLIVGLGNPGKEYDKTRHNVGFKILDDFVGDEKWVEDRYASFIKNTIMGEKVIFIKPGTFMNLSGQAVRYFKDYYKIALTSILIIHDDLDMEVGTFKLKINSSSGGHNGIKSIIESLGTNEFLRLKIGISKPENGDTVNYVLNNFATKDVEVITKQQKIYNNIINDFIDNKDADYLMNKYN